MGWLVTIVAIAAGIFVWLLVNSSHFRIAVSLTVACLVAVYFYRMIAEHNREGISRSLNSPSKPRTSIIYPSHAPRKF
jgi:membrane protein implicated in regulation of membrane protease activity